MRSLVEGSGGAGDRRRRVADRLTVVAADLTKDDGWDAAVAGCDYVLHVASPLGGDTSRDASALIVPAREGTLRVLRAATNAGVKRVVMTSAAAAARPPLPRTVSATKRSGPIPPIPSSTPTVSRRSLLSAPPGIS